MRESALHAQVLGGSHRLGAEAGILGLERPADVCGEATGLVLHVAQALEVLEAVIESLDVAKHHRRAGAQAELMADAHGFEPVVAIALERGDSIADAVYEDLAAAAGDRPEARFHEFRDDLAERHAEDLREVIELRRAEPVR